MVRVERDMISAASLRGLATLEDFDSIGANVNALGCPEEDPIPIDATYQAVEDLGKIFDVESEAAATIEDMKARIDEVQRRVEGLDPVPVFYYYGGEGPLGTWGKGSSQGQEELPTPVSAAQHGAES
jgi:ABC-type Fe3+-hydroxamate transport system substrate-binding protein